MGGERNLEALLAGMSPVLEPEPYVFATTKDPAKFAHLDAIMRFIEAEGETLILKAAAAQATALTFSEEYARITLNVHSALDAVGFIAAACSSLAEAGISTNAIAAYYHDHIFVPYVRAGDALRVLQDLSATARGKSIPPDC